MNTRALVVLLLVLIAGGVAAVALLGGDDGGEPATITTKIDNADGDLARDDKLVVPEKAVDQVERTDVGDHTGEREETAEVTAPPGPPVPEETTLASPEQEGCATRLVRNFSSRNGSSPRLWVLHYTVSPNRPGRSDVDGITAFFNNPAAQASSHYVIDNEGNCNLIVPEIQKSWTEGSFNPVGISVEVINTGSESTYAGTAGLDKLARVMSDSMARWKIPVQRGATSGCAVTRAGVVDHDSLGCGNNHTDIKPFSVDQVIAAVQRIRGETASPLTAREQKLVRGSCRPKGTGHTAKFWRPRARAHVARLDAIHRRGRPWKAKRSGTRRKLVAQAAAGKCN